MNAHLYIKSDFSAVFTVNGVFTEGKRPIAVRSDEVLFVTVFPISSAMLPYTVKLAGGRVQSNDDLAKLLELKRGEFLLRLTPRYSFVFPVCEGTGTYETAVDDIPVRFFRAVKSGDIPSSRAYLTSGLSASIHDQALASFFDGFEDIVRQEGAVDNHYYLLNKQNKPTIFHFVIVNNLIDDVSEL